MSSDRGNGSRGSNHLIRDPTEAEAIRRTFPKTRPPLAPAFQAIYASHYLSNRRGGTPAAALAQRVESWLHSRVAQDVIDCRRTLTTLEIGAGTLNQLAYEPNVGPYDIVEPFQELYENSPHLCRIRSIFAGIREVPLLNGYDRITSVATFEHLCDLPDVVARCGLLLRPDGSLRVSIPSEGCPLWTLGWKITTGLEFRLRFGLDYKQLMRHEHVNTADEVERVLRYFFATVECTVLGVNRKWSLYRYYLCRNAQKETCSDWLI